MTNSRNPQDLHPTLQRGLSELITRLASYPVGVSSTYRCFDYQNQLYAQGRTTPGGIVTNAKGGESFHNYRLAFDLFKNIKGSEYNDSLFFKTAGTLWQAMGGVWGGSFSTPDNCHFEYSGTLTIKELQKGLYLSQNAQMPWELTLAKTPPPQEDTKTMRYNHLSELPSWATDAISYLINKGHLQGTGQGFDLSLDMIRLLVINFRAGLYK